jgi:hypothetical protein
LDLIMAPRASRLVRLAFVAQAVLLTLLAAMLGTAGAQQNLLVNADLARGSSNHPDFWRSEAWVNSPEAFAYGWDRASREQPAQVRIDNLRPNDARLIQSLTLAPGWYHITAEIRTERVGAEQTGATISILEDSIMSPDVKGDTGWATVGFYLLVGASGANVDVALRLGGYGSLNTGRAFFRRPRVVAVAEPPATATPTYDLGLIRVQLAPKPIGSPLSLVLTIAALAGMALWGWRTFASASRDLAEAPAPPHRAKRKKPR